MKNKFQMRIERALERKRNLLMREKEELEVKDLSCVLIYPLLTHEQEFFID